MVFLGQKPVNEGLDRIIRLTLSTRLLLGPSTRRHLAPSASLLPSPPLTTTEHQSCRAATENATSIPDAATHPGVPPCTGAIVLLHCLLGLTDEGATITVGLRPNEDPDAHRAVPRRRSSAASAANTRCLNLLEPATPSTAT